MKRVVIAALAIVAMVGCAKEEKTTDGGVSNLETSFSSTIVESRASGTQWETGDVIGIMVTSNNSIVSTYTYNNKYNVTFEAETPEKGVFTADSDDDKIYYSSDENTYIDFYAYYPYNSELSATDQTYPIDVTTQTTPNKLDFMEASTRNDGKNGYNKNSGTVALTFNRNMAKLSFKLIGGTGVDLSDITGVSLEGLYTTAEYDFNTNSFGSLGGETTAITPLKEADDLYSAILIPEMTTSHKANFILKNGESVPLDITSQSLASGKHIEISVTVNLKEAVVSGNTIVGWDKTSEAEDLLID